jgi:hypothetical protein
MNDNPQALSRLRYLVWLRRTAHAQRELMGAASLQADAIALARMRAADPAMIGRDIEVVDAYRHDRMLLQIAGGSQLADNVVPLRT